MVRAVAAAIRAAADDPGEARRIGPLALIVSAIGYLVVILAILGALEIPVGRVLLGGALTGIILGIAAQQSLGNFFAGIVLLAVRPFSVGERVVLKSGPLGGEYEGIVTEMSMFYVHMMTDQGPVLLPNAGVLGAAIGPGAKSAEEEEPPERTDPGIQQGGTAAGP
jgi:small-conductance mechanosensitive channel